MSQGQREVVDPKLFVGDRGGLKKLKTAIRRCQDQTDNWFSCLASGGEEDLGEGGSRRTEN
jgi:hypothetical protein